MTVDSGARARTLLGYPGKIQWPLAMSCTQGGYVTALLRATNQRNQLILLALSRLLEARATMGQIVSLCIDNPCCHFEAAAFGLRNFAAR
jgi:hypothetical protein